MRMRLAAEFGLKSRMEPRDALLEAFHARKIGGVRCVSCCVSVGSLLQNTFGKTPIFHGQIFL